MLEGWTHVEHTLYYDGPWESLWLDPEGRYHLASVCEFALDEPWWALWSVVELQGDERTRLDDIRYTDLLADGRKVLWVRETTARLDVVP